jgi:hypothetical protein
VPIAIITNAARVSGTGILARYYGTRVADGFFHEFSGWVVYVAAFLLLFAFAWLLDTAARLVARRARRGEPKARAAAAARGTAPTARDDGTPKSSAEAEIVAETAP